MSEQQADKIINLLNQLVGLSSPVNQIDISLASTDFNPGRNFRLSVGVGGLLVGIDGAGNPFSHTVVVGEQVGYFSQITKTGTAATNLVAKY